MVATLKITKMEQGIGDVLPEPPIAWQTTYGAVVTINLEASNDFDELAEKRAWLALTESALAKGWDDDGEHL